MQGGGSEHAGRYEQARLPHTGTGMSTETKDPGEAIVGPLWAKILVQVAIGLAAIAAYVVALCGLAGALQGENPGPMPAVSPQSPFPADEVSRWVSSSGPSIFLYILFGLGVCAILAAIVLLAESWLTLPADHDDGDFGDHGGAVAATALLVAVLALPGCWQASPWKHAQPDYQQQANERFAGWAQDRYGIDLDGLEHRDVEDLMDGTEQPLVLDGGLMVGSYESNGNLLLTHGDSAEELDVVTIRQAGE